MNEVLEKILGVKIEYYVGVNLMKINMDSTNEDYYASLNQLQLDPRIVKLNNLKIEKKGMKVDFEAPIVCDIENIQPSVSMMKGIKFEGKDKNAFIAKIEETARNFGPEWEESVRKRKEEILKRADAKL